MGCHIPHMMIPSYYPGVCLSQETSILGHTWFFAKQWVKGNLVAGLYGLCLGLTMGWVLSNRVSPKTFQNLIDTVSTLGSYILQAYLIQDMDAATSFWFGVWTS